MVNFQIHGIINPRRKTMKKFLIVLMGLMVIGLCGCANGNEKDDGKKSFSTGSTSYAAYVKNTTGLDLDDGDLFIGHVAKEDFKYIRQSFTISSTKRYSLEELKNYFISLGFTDKYAAIYSKELFEVNDSADTHFLLLRDDDTLYIIINEG